MITGLHHVTALASDPQQTVNFYAGILGLRLVKKTINFDAPEVYHLYFGNEKADPGTLLTFFPYPDIPKGRKGKGQLITISFSVPENSLNYWTARLKKFGIKCDGRKKRFEEELIYFEDSDGLGLELVTARDNRTPFSYGNIPLEYAIQGFYGITLAEECYEKTVRLLTDQLDHVLILEKGNRFRFSASGEGRDFVDILCHPECLRGIPGSGTVHHVAFATPTDTTQIEARKKLLEKGLNVTPVLDRDYFHSIYFREPGGVLFEIATMLPGFTIDEPLDHLGESLKLPPWEEPNRPLIEKNLPAIHFDPTRYTD